MNNKKRVLFIITRLTIGGAAAYLIQTAKYLEEQGYECHIMTGSIEEHDLEMIKFHQEYTIKPLYLNELQRAINPWRDLLAILKLRKMLKELQPDIVHTHTSKAGMIGRITAWLCRVPRIYHTYHGLVFQGHFGKTLSKISVFIERLMAIISTKVISISPILTQELLRLRVCKAEKIVDIPLGFDLIMPTEPKSLRQLYQIPDDKIIVAAIGRFAKVKNHDLFIDIAERVCQRSKGIQFLMIGDGERRAELQELINKRNLQADIIITGFFNDLYNYYPEVDINLLTSLNEGTPVTIIESFFFNILVLSSAVGGIPDMIRDGYNGFLFDLNDTEGYVNRILDFVQNRDKYQQILSNGQRVFQEKYTLNVASEKLIKLFESVK